MSVYRDFTVEKISGEKTSLEKYDGTVSLIVNTASKCQFTYQFEQLQALYDQYKLYHFNVLGFPSNQFDEQEPGTSEEAASFCHLNYGVTFPMFKKIDVNGIEEAPLFTHLKKEAPFAGFDESNPPEKLLKMRLETDYPQWVDDSIKWNFTKFLINRHGEVVARFEPFEEPETFKAQIEKELEKVILSDK